MRLLVAFLACLLALILAGPAGAQDQLAPPGNGGVDQYLETLPGPDGNKPVNPVEPGPGGEDGGLPPAARSRLEAAGEDGRAAAALADATGPKRQGPSERPKKRDATPGPPAADLRSGIDDGGSAIGTVLSQVLGGDSDSGGLGTLLPLLLIIGLCGAAAVAVVLRRRRTPRE